MCERNDRLLLSVPSFNRETKEITWSDEEIDRCLVDIIDALNEGGIFTAMCCCGHGEHKGSIQLHDGRLLYMDKGSHYPGIMGKDL